MNNKQDRVYMDYAASTPVDPQVQKAMEPYWAGMFANPHAVHADGRAARSAVEKARGQIAKGIGSKPEELIFTSGGTEANTISLFGTIRKHKLSGRVPSDMHIITSSIEHPSILECLQELEKEGYQTTFLPVNSDGVFTPDVVAKALKPETVLVSLMLANNEIGEIEPIKEISKVIQEHREKNDTKISLHTDASQAPLYIDINVDSLGVDMMTTDAQKMYGPKGVGALYVRDGTFLGPLCKGGSQEWGIRSGTVNTPLVVAFGEAWELADENREKDNKHLKELQDYFLAQLEERVPKAKINGGLSSRLPNNINISIDGLAGEYAVIALDEAGISASTRSACLADGDEGSYVVGALGEGRGNASVRFSMGKRNTKEEVDYVVSILEELASRQK